MRVISILLALIFSASLNAAPTLGAVSKNADPVGRWKKFELSFPLTTWASNLFDPAQIDVNVTFSSPSGTTYKVNAFPYQAYTRSGSMAAGQTLTPSGGVVWKCRFSPPGEGSWSYVISATDTGGTVTSGAPQTFQVNSSTSRGFIQVSPSDNKYFRYDDGTTFFGVGENFCWSDQGGFNTYYYDDHLAKLDAQGGKLVRLWMATWGFAVEWDNTPLGNYANRQDRAWAMDRVFEQLEARGMVAELCLINHGPFSTTANSEWGANPFNSAKGGPLASPDQLWSSSQAQNYLNQRWRYITARWGYSTSLFAYELFNEVENTDNYSNRWSEIAAWHNSNATTIKNLHPQKHPVSTSVASYINGQNVVWPGMDFTQFHQYNAQDMAQMMRDRVAQYRGYKAAPVMGGEFGTDWDWSKIDQMIAADPDGLNLHEANWGSLMTGAGAGALSWWWDRPIDSNNWYPRYKGVSTFVAGEDLDQRGYQPQFGGVASPLKAYWLRGQNRVLGWVQHQNNTWYARSQAWAIGNVNGATLSVSGLSSNGAWTLQWYDSVSGALFSTQSVNVSNGSASLPIPGISSVKGDWAFKLFPANLTPSPTSTPVVFAIPGRVQVEDYSAAYDTSAGNQFGQYRAGDVDIEACADASGGFNIGEIAAGEWLEYQVHVASAGNYSLNLRVASQNAGPFSLQAQWDGANLGSPITFNGTGGWQTWATATASGFYLTAGRHTLRLNAQSALFNLNYIDVLAQVSATNTPTWTPSPIPTVTRVSGGSCKRVLAYYPSWYGSGYNASKLPFNKLTHICHAFIWPNNDGSLNIPAEINEPALISSAHAAGVKVLISVGGAGGSGAFASLAANSGLRATLINNLRNFCQQRGYDGVDYDWEFPSNNSDRANFTALVQETRAAFNAAGHAEWEISGAFSPGSYYGQFLDVPALANYLNYFNLMTYDGHGEWSAHSGHNAPLGASTSDSDGVSMQGGVDYYVNTRGLAASKINFGLAFYGRNFPTEDLHQSCPSCGSAVTYLSYAQIAPLINNGWTRYWDSAASSPYLRSNSLAQTISYDDPQSVQAKSNWALNTRGLGGVFMWEISQDRMGDGSQPLLDAMRAPLSCGPTATPTRTATPVIHAIPGRVQAEDFSAAYDSTVGNQFGQYRAGDVDIEVCADAGAGFNVGEVATGEWLEYQVNVSATGLYDLAFRVASQNSGPFSIQIQWDGANLGSAFAFNGSGGWQTWTTATLAGVSLSAGRHTLRLIAQTALFNLNYIDFTAQTLPTSTRSATPSSTRSVTALPSATFSPGVTQNATGEVTTAPSVLPSATASPRNTALPSATASPSNTALPSLTRSATPMASSSPTARASSTVSATATRTPSSISTATKLPTSQPTATQAPTKAVTATPVVRGNLTILQAYPVPNPNPTIFYANLSAWADQIELWIYSSANTLVAHQISGPHYNGWTLVYVPQDFYNKATNGVYYYSMVARSNAGAQSAPYTGTLAFYR